jgi:hypothetical protein
MHGISIPLVWWLKNNSMVNVTQAQIDCFNDPEFDRNSLQHNLIVEGILPHTTVERMMEFGNDLLCYEYVYSQFRGEGRGQMGLRNSCSTMRRMNSARGLATVARLHGFSVLQVVQVFRRVLCLSSQEPVAS